MSEVSSPGWRRRKPWMTGASRAASSAGRVDPARESSPVAVPSAGTGVARAMSRGYLSKGSDRYLVSLDSPGSPSTGQRRFPLPPLPSPLRGRGGGRLPAGRVDPEAGLPVAPLAPMAAPATTAAPAAVAVPPLAEPPERLAAEAAPGRMTPAV